MKPNFFKSDVSNLKPVKQGKKSSSGGGDPADNPYHLLPPDDMDSSDDDMDSSDSDKNDKDVEDGKGGDSSGPPSKVSIKGNPKPMVDIIPEGKSIQDMFGQDAKPLAGSDGVGKKALTREDLKKAIEKAQEKADKESGDAPGMKGVGKGMGGRRHVEPDIFPVKTDWAGILINLLKKEKPGPTSYSKIHRKTFGSKIGGRIIIKPGTTTKPDIGKVVVAIDTSGSITSEILTGFMSDLKRLFNQFQSSKSFAVTVVLWSDGPYNSSKEFNSSEFNALRTWIVTNAQSGGTSISTVIDFIKTSIPKLKTDYVATIWFTDGEVYDLNKPLPDMDNVFVLQGHDSNARAGFLASVQKFRPKNKKITTVKTDY